MPNSTHSDDYTSAASSFDSDYDLDETLTEKLHGQKERLKTPGPAYTDDEVDESSMEQSILPGLLKALDSSDDGEDPDEHSHGDQDSSNDELKMNETSSADVSYGLHRRRVSASSEAEDSSEELFPNMFAFVSPAISFEEYETTLDEEELDGGDDARNELFLAALDAELSASSSSETEEKEEAEQFLSSEAYDDQFENAFLSPDGQYDLGLEHLQFEPSMSSKEEVAAAVQATEDGSSFSGQIYDRAMNSIQDKSVGSYSFLNYGQPAEQEESEASNEEAELEEEEPEDGIMFAYNDQEIELEVKAKTFQFFSKENNDAYSFLNQNLVEKLADMGISKIRPVQLATIQALFYKISETTPDFIGISSTGSGKTIAFLVPIIQKCLEKSETSALRTPTALIFAHSNPLVLNIYEQALQLIKGTQVVVQLITSKQKFLRDSNFDIGICTTGRFKNHFGRDASARDVKFDLSQLEYVVIDEADKMGEDDYFPILYQQMKEVSDFVTLCFSATAYSSIAKFINEENYYEFRYGGLNKVPENVKQIFWRVNSKSFMRVTGIATGKIKVGEYGPGEVPNPFDEIYLFLNEKMKEEPEASFVIFCKRTCVADFLAQHLTNAKINAVAVHGDINYQSRQKFLECFNMGKVKVLVGTQMLTRGMDFKERDVKYVINYDLPEKYREYVHRCGRTGRNGKSGTAISLIDQQNPSDYNAQVIFDVLLNVPDAQKNDFDPWLKRLYSSAKKQEKARRNDYQRARGNFSEC